MPKFGDVYIADNLWVTANMKGLGIRVCLNIVLSFLLLAATFIPYFDPDKVEAGLVSSYYEDFEGSTSYWLPATQGNGSLSKVQGPSYPVHSGSYSWRLYSLDAQEYAAGLLGCPPGYAEYTIDCWTYVKQRSDGHAASVIGFVFNGTHVGWNPYADNAGLALIGDGQSTNYRPVGLPKNSWHDVKVTYYTADATFSIWLDSQLLYEHIKSNKSPGISPDYYMGFACSWADNSVDEQYFDDVTVSSFQFPTLPAKINDLSAQNINANSVLLNWTAPGRDGNTGTALQYDIRYSTTNITESNWASATKATGFAAPKPAGSAENCTVSGLSPGVRYYFALKTAGDPPYWSSLSNVASSVLSNQPPTCSLTPDKTAGNSPLTVTFTLGASDVDGSVTAWVLDVNGDGIAEFSGAGTPPTTESRKYSAPGSYNVIFMVTDNSGNVSAPAIRTVNVTAANQPPTCSFSANHLSGKAPLDVTFALNASDADGTIAAWVLDVNSDCVAENKSTGSPPPTVNYIYTDPGSYTAIFMVTDNSSNVSAPAIQTINVNTSNQLPICSLKPSISLGSAPLNVIFRLNASDADGTIASWQLDIDNDGVAEYLSTGNPPPSINHTYTSVGSYTAVFKVTDNKGAISAPAITTITVANNPPTVTVTSPKAGDIWPAASSQNYDITWTASDKPGNLTYKIYYTENETMPEEQWPLIDTFTKPQGPQSYSWHPPLYNSNICKVKVAAIDADKNEGDGYSARFTLKLNHRPVLLVHGIQIFQLLGWPPFDPVESWTRMAENLASNLMYYMKQCSDSSYYHPWYKLENRTVDDRLVYISNYSHDNADSTVLDLRYYARNLSDEIRFIKKETNTDKVDIVAHSMGGLVSRTYVEIGDFGNDNPYQITYNHDVDKLVMLGTPNHGQVWEVLTHIYTAGFPDSFCVQQMEAERKFLNTLNYGIQQDGLCPGSTDILNQEIEYSTIAGNLFTNKYVSFLFSKLDSVLQTLIDDSLGIQNDGVVSCQSVKLYGIPLYTVAEEHLYLFKNESVITAVKQALNSQPIHLDTYLQIAHHCPVHITITDQYGNYISDNGSCTIQGASVFTDNVSVMTYFNLPRGLNYSVITTGYDSGTLSFIEQAPVGDTGTHVSLFKNIPVSAGSRTSFSITSGSPDGLVFVDSNGDGIPESTKAPDESTTITKPDEPLVLSANAKGANNIDLSWMIGSGAQKTMIRYRSDGQFPVSPSDGTLVYFDTGSSYSHTGLSSNTAYLYSAWSWLSENSTDIWSDNCSRAMVQITSSLPTITNASGATSIMANTAIINGSLTSAGDADTTVTIYGGTTDGERGTWDHVYDLGVRSPGAFSLGVTGLTPGTTYYYRCSATNSSGTSWAEPSVTFTTQQPLGLWRNYWAGPGKDWHWFSSGVPK